MNTRQRRFVLNLFQGMNQTDAYINAGYNVSRDVAGSQASMLLANPSISKELNRLEAKKEAVIVANEVLPAIATALSKAEKRNILAEIARARLVDFTQDGEPTLSGNTPNARAAREYYHRTRYDKDGNPIITKNIKLIDPIAAIAEDNKMAGDYAPTKHLVAQKVVFEINQIEHKKRGSEEK